MVKLSSHGTQRLPLAPDAKGCAHDERCKRTALRIDSGRRRSRHHHGADGADHTRDYFRRTLTQVRPTCHDHRAAIPHSLVKHICAPVFFPPDRNGSISRPEAPDRAEVRVPLARGAWLIGCEFTLFRCLGLQFNFDYQLTVITVLWALGWSMIALALLIRLPAWVAAVVGMTMIGGHNLLDGVTPASFGSFGWLWSVLHVPNVIYDDGRHIVFATYPLVPWIGVTAVGFALGQVYTWDASRRRTWLFRTGCVLTVLFVALRLLNGYGDPAP